MSVIGSNILAGAAGQGGGYVIDNSLRFRSSASAYLNRTPGSASNQRTFTFSMWFKRGELGSFQDLYVVDQDSNHQFFIELNSTNNIRVFDYQPSAFNLQLVTTAVYRDPSAWYHLVVAVDTTQATAANRCVIYVNGSQVTALSTATYPTQNYTTMVDTTQPCRIGNAASVSRPFDGYLTEVNFIDGQALTPSDFGDYNEDTGVWQPAKYAGSYGTNGFYLNFSDNTTTTTLAADSSGNGNDWTPNNISLTAGVTYDSMTDTPTPYADGGNYAVLNPLRQNGSATFAQGNLAGTSESGTSRGLCSTIVLPRSDKWYMEWTPSSSTTNWFGVTANEIIATDINTAGQQSVLYYAINGTKWVNGSNSAYGSSYTTQTIGIAFDGPAGTVTFYRDNVSQGAISLPSSTVDYVFCMGNAGGGGVTNYANFGQRPFAYTPPTGFLPLHTGNLPDSAIVDGSEYFDVVTRTGTGAEATVTGLQFQPDLLWTKTRSNAVNHSLTSTGLTYNYSFLQTNTTEPENTSASQYYMIPTADGYTVGTGDNINQVSRTFVDWVWKANGAGVSNDEGSITSTVSANTTAGFSIVTYTGTGVAATVGHGLGAAPSMVIVKKRNAAADWVVKHASLSSNDSTLILTNTSAQTSYSPSVWNNTAPTSSVFSIGTNSASNSANTFVAYCFSEVSGYSKFGSYTGNGSTDGPFVYTGFRPAFVMMKRSNSTGNWTIFDTGRQPVNLGTTSDPTLYPNLSIAEATGIVDILSNGFKIRYTDGDYNTNGGTYIYMAFAENPFKNSLAR